jgi:hypothetical protein
VRLGTLGAVTIVVKLHAELNALLPALLAALILQ